MKRKFHELNLYYRHLENTYFDLKDSDSWIIFEFWRHFQWFLILIWDSRIDSRASVRDSFELRTPRLRQQMHQFHFHLPNCFVIEFQRFFQLLWVIASNGRQTQWLHFLFVFFKNILSLFRRHKLRGVVNSKKSQKIPKNPKKSKKSKIQKIHKIPKIHFFEYFYIVK